MYAYDVGADGSVTLCDDYTSSGSGSVIAYGVLETLYKKDTWYNQNNVRGYTLDAVVDNYFVILEKLGEQIAYLEEDVVKSPTLKTFPGTTTVSPSLQYLFIV